MEGSRVVGAFEGRDAESRGMRTGEGKNKEEIGSERKRNEEVRQQEEREGWGGKEGDYE